MGAVDLLPTYELRPSRLNCLLWFLMGGRLGGGIPQGRGSDWRLCLSAGKRELGMAMCLLTGGDCLHCIIKEQNDDSLLNQEIVA